MPTVPTADTTDIMQAALDEAGFNADGELAPEPDVTEDPETTIDDVTPEATETSEEPEAATESATETTETTDEVDPEAAKAAAAKALNQDEYDLLCDELGFRAPKPGQRENKIPVSRVRARVKTAIKKYAEKFGLERNELTGKVSAADAELQTFRRVDQAIAAGAVDPAAARRYIEMLAAVHPAYKVFLGGSEGGVTAAAVPQALKDLGPKPGPDLKYDDGTVGFSPEQLEKRDEWLAASAEIRGYERSKKEFETRFGPMESEHRQRLTAQQEAPKVLARISAIREQWGEPFLAQERMETAQKGSSDIAKYQAAHPGVPFEQVVAAVLLPKLRADRTTMRADIIRELNGKKKAAKPSVGQATRTTAPAGPKSTIDIINEELDRAGLGRD